MVSGFWLEEDSGIVIEVIVWVGADDASAEVIVAVDCVAKDESTTVEVRADVSGALEGRVDPPAEVVGAEVEAGVELPPVPSGII